MEKAILLDKLASEYGSYDDRVDGGDPVRSGHRPTLGEVAENNGLGIVKVRKLLVTAGVYSTRKSRWIRQLQDQGDSIDEIVKKTGLTKGSVYSYLPYKNVVYNLSERSPESDRSRLYQKRKAAVEEVRRLVAKEKHEGRDKYQDGDQDVGGLAGGKSETDGLVEAVRKALHLFVGYYFETEEGRRFRIEVDDEGVRFADDGDELTWEGIKSVVDGSCGRTEALDAYQKAVFKRVGLLG